MRIPLTRGLFAAVDPELYEALSGYSWSAIKPKSSLTWYAVRSEPGSKRMVYMHRVVARAVPGTVVDHRDRDGLNNVASNLRVCTRSQNQHNRGVNRNNTSGHKGVTWNANASKWCVSVWLNGASHYGGLFVSLPEAAEEARRLRAFLHEDFARDK